MREHDFDAARNDTDKPPGFILRDETFRVVWNVRPELIYGWEDAIRDIEAGSMGLLDANDRLITGFLHPDDRERWQQLRDREDDPVTSADIWELIRWLRETDSGRPTTAPRSSQPGREDTPASSEVA